MVLLAIFLLASFASAANVFPDKITGNNVAVSHGEKSQVTFFINNTFDKALVNARIRLPATLSSVGSWSNVKIGSSEYQIISNLVSIPGKIAPNTISEPITLTFNVNKYALPSPYTARVSFLGDYEAGSTNVQIDPLDFSFNVSSFSALSISKIQDLTRIQNATINVTNIGNVVLDKINISSTGTLSIVFPTEQFSLSPGNSRLFQVNSDFTNLRFGENTATISLSSGSATASTSFSLTNSFCRNGAVGRNLSITKADINSEGDEDTTWKALDIVSVEVEVSNDGSDDIRDVIVELGLFNSEGRNLVKDLEFINTDKEKIKAGRINNDDSKVVTFEFKVPADIGSGSKKLAVKAYSKDLGETNMCADSNSDLNKNVYQEIDVDQEDEQAKFIVFDNIKFGPETVTCGDTTTLSFDAFNVGDEDQDQVKYKVISRELGIDTSTEIKEDLNQGDKKVLSFTFTVPGGLADKIYPVLITADYDYTSGQYRESSEDEAKGFLKVIGCVPSVITGKLSSVSAELTSEAKAGQELKVKATIRNLAFNATTFIISGKNYETWGKLTGVSERLFSLNAGESKDIIFSFDVNSDVSGEKAFNIEVLSGNKAETTEVAVQFAESSSFFSSFKNNSLAWIFGIINVLLIILIIIFVAVRASRR